MGAWGSEPKDNDGTGDKFDAVIAAAAREVHKLFRKSRLDADERWERLGVLQDVVERMPAVIDRLQDPFKIGRSDVDILLEDEEFLARWKSPATVRRNLEKMGKLIDAILIKM